MNNNNKFHNTKYILFQTQIKINYNQILKCKFALKL